MTVTLKRNFDPLAPGAVLGTAWPASPCLAEEPEQGVAVLRDLGS